ncbi:hypothetical protein BSL78_05856 [Apostichopus japonicus]|uniref:Fibrinogen C-terminal domain-containing protein n=1 Tax=Stichopus japonicus TaxID=307972 RepID=A0A2G8LAN5_STIJA|nr:hypothetical protein BSL78_05856 [Apostichopus japonicus]
MTLLLINRLFIGEVYLQLQWKLKDFLSRPMDHYFFYQRSEYPKDCRDVQSQCSTSNSSGVYIIKPDGFEEPFEVYCNNDVGGGGWTVIQRRDSGAVNFNRSWSQYQYGFGFLSTEFWIGNEKLSYLTNQADYEVRVDMELSNGASFYTTYKGFHITDEWGQYKVTHIGPLESNAPTLPSTCPTNMIYGTCTCQATCEDPDGKSGCKSDCLGSEGCTCPPGFFMQGSDCISAIECGCFVAEVILILPVFQRRTDGSTNFYQNWNMYKDGFGHSGNLWLGNEKLHYLTNQRNYKLRYDITTSSGSATYAEYTEFQIESEINNYRMNKLGTHSGDTAEENSSARMTETMTHAVTSTAHSYTEAVGGTMITLALIAGVLTIGSNAQYSSRCKSKCTYYNLNGVYNGGNGK